MMDRDEWFSCVAQDITRLIESSSEPSPMPLMVIPIEMFHWQQLSNPPSAMKRLM
jgi:hypothetical protein